MKKSIYVLRYYLPCEPICDEVTTQRRSESLIAYCLKNHIEAVMLYVELNPYWYYAPDTPEHNRYYRDAIVDTIERLRANGISYQLNYQNLIGAWDGGADSKETYGWEFFVDQYGLESQSSACCIGERFRKIAGEKLALWAETKPDVIWIDDDIRFHNHGAVTREAWQGRPHSVDFGCFCEHHIARFNETYQRNCTRETLVAGILDGTLREDWLQFSKEVADEFMAWIEETIHRVSPETRIAMMTSLPDIHSVEGRNWGSFLSNLSGEYTPIMRPTFGPYEENNPRNFCDSYWFVEQLKANIRSQYDKEFIFCPEIENTRFTRWSKSVTATGFQLMLSAFLGCKGVTLSLFDLEGCVLEEEPEFAELLVERRVALDTLANVDLWHMESEGIALVTAPDRVNHAFFGKKVNEMLELAGSRQWDKQLLQAGIPCRYVTPELAKTTVGVALDAYTASLLNEEEILGILKGGVILDAGAAKVLEEKGFGAYLGIRVGELSPCIAATEVFHTMHRSDGSIPRVPLRANGYHWNHLELDGAEALTSVVTPYGISYPGVTRFRNSLGGSVWVFAQNGNFGDGFYSNYRMRFLKQLCREATGEKLVLTDNFTYGLTAVKKTNDTIFVFSGNLMADVVEDVVILGASNVKSAEWMDVDGVWHPAETSDNQVICKQAELGMYGCLICKIQAK